MFLSIWDIIEFQAGAKGLCKQLPQWEGCFLEIISGTQFVSSFPDASYLKLACFKPLGVFLTSDWKLYETVFTDWIYFEYFENRLLKFHCRIKHQAELSLGMDFKSEIFGF